MVLEHGGKFDADPISGVHVKSLRGRFRELFREATIDGIVLRKEITRQSPVLLNFPAEVSKLLQSLNAFDMEFEEARKFALQIDPPSNHREPDTQQGQGVGVSAKV